MSGIATKRLLKDLELLENDKIPKVGVTARPLEHDLFVWHANIRGPEKSKYEGGIFHLELQIPQSYPHQPPQIKVFTELPHPNVFGQSICLDMLQKQNSDGSGWSSAYTIQSILIQLQSFLFEELISEDQNKTDASIKKAVQAANNFKCKAKNCKHGGRLSCWPAFNSKESDVASFVMPLSEKELFEKELLCFHTKLPYRVLVQQQKNDESKVKLESCLGILLNVNKVPRTGQVKQALPSHDYISLKAFLNEGIKWDSMNQIYTHWLPLYLGKTDNKERVINLAKRALSMIMTNHTRRFRPEFIVEVFPKITQTICFQMMDEKTHPSIRYFRLLAHVHALWLLMMEQYPELYDQVDQILGNFISNEKYRTKDHTPNLGILFNLLYVSKKYTFKDLVESYSSEQLDRQVFWLLKEIPELDDPKLYESITPLKRVKITFAQQKTSFQMGAYQYVFLKIVKKSATEMLAAYENNFSRLAIQTELDIQQEVFKILKKINDYDSFFDFVELPRRSIEEMDARLKQAVLNSKLKKYHGKLDEINELPDTSVQVQNYKKNLPKLEDYFEVSSTQQNKKWKHEVKVLKEQTEKEWKEVCAKRWLWIKEQLRWEPEASAIQLAKLSNQKKTQSSKEICDRLFHYHLQNQVDEKSIKIQDEEIPLPETTWKTLFMKLDLEEFLEQFDLNPDFKSLYAKIQIVKDSLNNLILPLITVTKVNSAYHYLTGTLEQLSSLQQLIIVGQTDVTYPKKAIRSIYKGLNNLGQQQNQLVYVSYIGTNFAGNQSEITDCIFSPIQNNFKNLKALSLNSTLILNLTNASKAIGGIVTNMKNLQQIILRNSINSQAQAKELTDGLMRAKQIRYVDISNNLQITDKGLSSIIYNLSFSPKLVHLNISRCAPISAYPELVESLYKLLRITGSLEYLNLSNLASLNTHLNLEFFQALGETKSLKILDLSDSGALNGSRVADFGKSVALNAKKNGSLEYIFLNGTSFKYRNFVEIFCNNLFISEHDHEVWYGDQLKAQKMTGDDYKKKFYCNLKNFSIARVGFESAFNLNSFKKNYKPENPGFTKFITNCKELEFLDLASNNMKKQDADLLLYSLFHQDQYATVKVLNLRKNQLGKEGAKIIAQLLENNPVLEVLDISKNNIGVSGGQAIALALGKNEKLQTLNVFNNKIGYDGAKEFGNALAINKSLRFLELGHNRIRNKGLLVIGEGLSKNSKIKLEVLGLRFNFLSEDGLIDFFKLTKETSIKELYIKNNSINEYGLFQLKDFFDGQKYRTNVDLFEKFNYNDDSTLERTIWIHPNFPQNQIKKFFQDKHDCGVILDVRTRKAPKYPNRTMKPNCFNFIEFADVNSLTRAMHLAARRESNLNGINFRVYKAGTGTFQYQKKSAKQKKAESSKTNVLAIQDARATRPTPKRGRVRGGRGGRGAPRGRGGR